MKSLLSLLFVSAYASTPLTHASLAGLSNRREKTIFLHPSDLLLYTAGTAMLVTLTMQNRQKLEILFRWCLEKLLCTPTKELRETTSGERAQIMPCWATPCSIIPGAIHSLHVESHFSSKHSSPSFESPAQMLGRKMFETSGWMGFETPQNI